MKSGLLNSNLILRLFLLICDINNFYLSILLFENKIDMEKRQDLKINVIVCFNKF